jgi:hypothetical protein
MAVQKYIFRGVNLASTGVLQDQFGTPLIVPVVDGVTATVSVLITSGTISTWSANVRAGNAPCGPFTDFATPIVLNASTLKKSIDCVGVDSLAFNNTTPQASLLAEVIFAVSDRGGV